MNPLLMQSSLRVKFKLVFESSLKIGQIANIKQLEELLIEARGSLGQCDRFIASIIKLLQDLTKAFIKEEVSGFL